MQLNNGLYVQILKYFNRIFKYIFINSFTNLLSYLSLIFITTTAKIKKIENKKILIYNDFFQIKSKKNIIIKTFIKFDLSPIKKEIIKKSNIKI